MSTETAITRVQAFTTAWKANTFRTPLIAFEIDTTHAEHQLRIDDLAALLQILADYCENDPDTDHTTCVGCDQILCTSCGLGDTDVRCQDDSDGPHCTSCWHHCRTCSLEVAEDTRAEAYADAHGMRY